MSIIDFDAIRERVREEGERLRLLGISEDKEKAYYNSLSFESCDPAHDQAAFDTVIAGLGLSADGR